MKIMTLNAAKREKTGKGISKRTRLKGIVPGIVYGASEEPAYLELVEHDLKIFLQKTGEHALIQLAIDAKTPFLAMLAEIQHHPVSDRILHVDFKYIPSDKPVAIKVPIKFIGESAGIHAGGFFMPRLHVLDVKALPDDVPQEITIDITGLDFDNVLHVRDLDLPEGLEILHDPAQTVATVIKPRGLEAEEEAEVEGEGEEGEGEEGDTESEGSEDEK